MLASHASDVAGLLDVFDRRARHVATSDTDWVVTHGEPNAGNVIQADERLALVDWDTVAVARPERDLWMVVGTAEDEIGLYADATGHRVDSLAVEFFRIAWELADLAVCVSLSARCIEKTKTPSRHLAIWWKPRAFGSRGAPCSDSRARTARK